MIILYPYPITNCSGIFVPHFCLDLIKNKIQGTVTINEKSMLEIQLIISGASQKVLT